MYSHAFKKQEANSYGGSIKVHTLHTQQLQHRQKWNIKVSLQPSYIFVPPVTVTEMTYQPLTVFKCFLKNNLKGGTETVGPPATHSLLKFHHFITKQSYTDHSSDHSSQPMQSAHLWPVAAAQFFISFWFETFFKRFYIKKEECPHCNCQQCRETSICYQTTIDGSFLHAPLPGRDVCRALLWPVPAETGS